LKEFSFSFCLAKLTSSRRRCNFEVHCMCHHQLYISHYLSLW